jgi:hypothetical protein
MFLDEFIDKAVKIARNEDRELSNALFDIRRQFSADPTAVTRAEGQLYMLFEGRFPHPVTGSQDKLERLWSNYLKGKSKR